MNVNRRYPLNEQGFTFIELIIYVAIVSIVLTALTQFTLTVIGGSAKSMAEQEVSSQARSISERIRYEIRNATGITSVTSTSVSLAVSNATNNPTVIDLSSGKIRITLGAASAVNLNSGDTVVSDLTFTNYSSFTSTTKHIQFSFTIDDAFSGTRQEYEVQPLLVQSSAEIRSN